MTFSDALNVMRKGKRIRRRIWNYSYPDYYCIENDLLCICFYDDEEERHIEVFNDSMKVEDIMAYDWEVVE